MVEVSHNGAMMEDQSREQAIGRLRAMPRLNLSHRPSPIEELPRLRAALGGGPRILIKRDDYLGPGFGGNKVRKLEYLLAAAKRDGAEVVITCGGVKSNHARVTAALCARVGMECVLVLNPAAVGYAGLEPASLRADRLYGAKIRLIADRAERQPEMERLAQHYRAAGRQVVVIPLGASVPLGAIGLVEAAGEAAAQLAEMGVRVDSLYHCSSSGGTQAGLVVGREIFPGLASEVIGVSPDGTREEIASVVEGIVRGAKELLGLPSVADERVRVIDDYIGEGYGIPTAAGEEALELLARTEGVLLDPVYTAKAMAAMLDRIRSGLIADGQTLLFWHTGGQLAIFYAPEQEA
ncbi:MAG: 1-aminocyclopropane-1-carboxylate deaminase/D-cysteine desulfhydrase [Blastocatellia bacterium]